MYNSYQQPSPYGRTPDYGGFPGPAPAMGAPPGMAPPGTAAPPGMQQNNQQQPGSAGGFPPNFQMPANMPNINFSAPVIRLGTSGPSKPADSLNSLEERDRSSRRPGLGAAMHTEPRHAGRDATSQLIPPSNEEILRTIYVGGITEEFGGDEGVERILRAAGNIRRWSRAMDADGKPCKFGFAEYEDLESLNVAVEVLKDVNIASPRQSAKDDVSEKNDGTDNVTLLVNADDKSLQYLKQWEEAQGGQDAAQTQMRLDHARNALQAVLSDLQRPSVPVTKDETSKVDGDNDLAIDHEPASDSKAEVVTIPITVDDELSDIPADMRETVAKEIAAFRDRSTRRDLERLKREEEAESLERARNVGGLRHNRLASPPPTAPSGPAGGANGIPVAPRERPLNAPSGPKGFGQQVPRDYHKGVAFVNGSSNHDTVNGWLKREDEDSEASDEELERRRKSKKDAELEKQYLDQERRWLNRERSRTAAVEREKHRDKEEDGKMGKEKEKMLSRLKEWNDDVEAKRKMEDYYRDRSMWARNRVAFRHREAAMDELDRAAEYREHARAQPYNEKADVMADDFLNRQADAMENKATTPAQEPQRFKLSLGAAAQQRAQTTANQTRRGGLEVEGLLEDQEDDEGRERRTLIPIQYEDGVGANDTGPGGIGGNSGGSGGAGIDHMTDEERAQVARKLAQDIPTDRDGLWAWEVQWDYVDDAVISEQIKPFVEKKIMEYLGVQEQMLVDVVASHLTDRKGPQELVERLEEALEEEAEVLVKKLWRMVIFFSESEKRGLSG